MSPVTLAERNNMMIWDLTDSGLPNGLLEKPEILLNL